MVSTYHYLVEWNPSLEGGACGVGPACSAIWFRELGFVTLSFMALCGFVAILVLVVPRPPDHPGALVSPSRSRTPLILGIVLAVVAVVAIVAVVLTSGGDDDGDDAASDAPVFGVVTVEGDRAAARASTPTTRRSATPVPALRGHGLRRQRHGDRPRARTGR